MARTRQRDDRVPPLRVVALHGAGSGPWIFDGWELTGAEVVAVDLHAGLDVGRTSMLNYEAAATRACEGLGRPLALLGWSMGGLVAMMAARRAEPDRIVLLEPSPPGAVERLDEQVELEEGVYDPEEVYGPFPTGVRARPESRLARGERRRGVPVPRLPAPALVVYGDEHPDERGRGVARRFAGDELYRPGLAHWDLVRDRSVQAAIADWLARPAPPAVT